MADKMAVMAGGSLQQYAAPAEVFANPLNTFVASFVGSPAMSLVPLTAQTCGTDVVLRHADAWELPLSAANARKARRAAGPEVILGARRSTIALHKTPQPGAVPARVYTVEPTGDITFVQVHLGPAVVVVSLDPHVPIAPDEQVWLSFDQGRMHLFDARTQLALHTIRQQKLRQGSKACAERFLHIDRMKAACCCPSASVWGEGAPHKLPSGGSVGTS